MVVCGSSGALDNRHFHCVEHLAIIRHETTGGKRNL